MYNQGKYAPQFGQGTQTPRPPLQQCPLTPHFQSGPPSVTPQVDYSSSFQYQHPPPLPGQHGPPVRLPTTGVPNAPQSYHLPPRSPQVHVSNSALPSYPTAQQNTHRAQNIQHTPLPPPGPHRPEMFQPPVPYRGSTYAPHPSSMRSTSQLPPPPPLPTSNFFSPAPVFAMGPTPPPLPPSSPPPVPPSPPPTIPTSFGALTSTTLDAACESPHILKSVLTSIVSASETLGSDSADKVVPTSETMVDTNTADDKNKHLTGRTSAKVGSSASGNSSSEETAELDLLPPPPKPGEENVVQKIEVLCRFIAKNGPGFEYMTRQKESANPEFRFLFGGEPGSEVAVAHEYFKWVKKKCLLQHSRRNSAVELSEMLSSVQTNPVDTDVSPSVSDMEMEDDFTKPADIHCETVFMPEEHDNREQLCGPQNFLGSNLSWDTVSTFSQLAEEEKGIGSRLSLPNDQPTRGNAFSVVDSLNVSPSGADKLAENSFIGVSSSSPFEDINSTGKPPGELIKGASPIRLLQGYVSDDSSERDDKPSLGDFVPMAVPPSNTACDTSLRGDMQSNILTDRGLKILPNPELAFGKSFESGEEHPLSSPSNDQEPLPKSQCAAEEASTGTVQAEEFAVSPEAFRGKDVLNVVHEVALEKRKHQVENVQRTSILRKVDEFGRLVRDVSSDSDPDESRRTGKHGKRGRSRSRSPHDRRSWRSPRRRREKRSWSRSWSPKKRRSRSRSPFHRRGIESGGERVRKDKGRLPDCLDFLRGRCHRGASCRYMHHETDKSAGARYNRSTRTSDRREEVEKLPSKRSVYEHDLRGSGSSFVEKETPNREELLSPPQGFVQTTVSDQDDNILVTDVCNSEKSNATVLESSDMEILEPTHKLLDFENRERNMESDHVVDRSSSRLIDDGFFVSSVVDSSRGIASSTEELVTEKSQAKIRIEISEPELNKNASSISNEGAHFEPPAPHPPVSHGTCVPPPLVPKERVQPPINYPYQGHFQMQQPCYPTPPNTWPPPPPPLLQPQFTNNFSAATAIQGVPPPPFQQNQFPPRNDYRMFQHHSYPVPSSQIEDIRSKPLSMDNTVSQTYESHLSSFSLPSLGHSTTSGLRFGSYGNINAPFEGSKIALHYNPYASTFDQPFDSKFNSNVMNHGKDLPYANPYGASHSLSHTPVDPQAVISPAKTAQAAELPKSGSDQYDPLFDSIEPPLNSFKKLNQSESTLRLSSSRKALDVGENSKQKEVEAAAISTSIKSNEEFGETADAEVGEVESERSSNPLDGGHAAVGEVEIDQEKTPENGKKSKDSRSMKLFKSSLAEYVKEVLKPHWRQGGMSKEAFKIIVKKTIDKVSGAMKSHHIPKSQEKISRYIDSSERKLNKLVMGYVDKYAKI